MRKIIIALGLTVLSTPVFACQLNLPESEVRRALNPPVSGHYVLCDEKTSEKCYCMDSIDPYTYDLIDGQLVYNSDKAFALKLALEKAEAARLQALAEKKAAEEYIESFEPKGNSIAALKAEMKQLADAIKKIRK